MKETLQKVNLNLPLVEALAAVDMQPLEDNMLRGTPSNDAIEKFRILDRWVRFPKKMCKNDAFLNLRKLLMLILGYWGFVFELNNTLKCFGSVMVIILIR